MKLTLRQLFFIVLFLGLFLMTLRPIADPDFWWHLRTGQLIFQTRAIPHIDPFSFTKAGGVWITHEWLSELIIYLLFKLGGYGLLIFAFSILITGAFYFSYLRAPMKSRPYIAGFALLLGALSTAPTWGVRPQMLSLFFASLFLYFLDHYQTSAKLKFILPLPLLTLLWVNLHAGYLIGLSLIAFFIIGGLTDLLLLEFQIIKHPYPSPTLRSILILCGTLAICILVTIINPNGIKILTYPFQTLFSPSMQQFIQEWFSPDFHQIIWLPFAFIILGLIGLGMVSKKSISPTNIILTLVFGYAALRSMRNIPFFAISVIPILAEQVDSMIEIRTNGRTPSRMFHYLVPPLLAILVLLTGLRFFQVARSQSQTESDSFPKAAVDWILSNRPSGNIFNSYGWGGYLIWRAYPEYKVFIDGRADVYGDSFLYDYMTIYRSEPGWEDKLKNQGVQTVIVEPNAPLANTLLASQSWKIVFEDKISVIFKR